MSRPKFAILVSFSGQGGVERMIANLSQAIVRLEVDLDLLLIKNQGPHTTRLPTEARQISLGSGHTATSIVSVALLPLSLFWVASGTQDSTFGVVLMLAIIGFVGLAGVRMVRIGLDVTPLRALALFLLTMLLSLVVDYYVRHWLGVAVDVAPA
ncbi:MAG: hypothetical protein AAGF46_13225 [Pseudomonadota bacterium]